MSELRHDPIQRRWVIIATDRSRRPTDFQSSKEMPAEGSFCPFCAGNEEKTPPEICAVREGGGPANSGGWKVRVVPNKFPALTIEGELERKGIGIYDRLHGIGAHEVVVESPDHDLMMAQMSRAQLGLVLSTYQSRLKDLLQDPRFKYVLIFKNHGAVAGASLFHPHTQIIATPVTPRTVALELTAAQDHHQLKERCLFCDAIDQELEEKKRVVYADDRFVALCPYASRFPFEILLLPRVHRHSFAEATPAELEGLAVALREVLARLAVTLDDPPFNFMFHTSPNTSTLHRRPGYWVSLAYDYHWHIEILPRLTRVAGFEWGTGFYINPTAPEDAARYLRDARILPID